MASVNKVILIGNLGRDPELRYTQGGQGVCNFSLATTERWRDKDNQSHERTEWHRIIVWGKQGENCAQYLKKGRSCYVEGRLHLDTWQDRETGKNRQKLRVVGERMQFVGSTPQGEGANRNDGGRKQPRAVAA